MSRLTATNSQAEMESALRQREQLVLAEKLFGMPITSYPEMGQVRVIHDAGNVFLF